MRLEDFVRLGIADDRKIEWDDDPKKRARQLVPYLCAVERKAEEAGFTYIFYIWDLREQKEVDMFQYFGMLEWKQIVEHVRCLRHGGLPWPSDPVRDPDTGIPIV